MAKPEQFLYLTTRGRKSGLPREIEIWFTQWDGRFYLIAEYPTSHWLQNVQADPNVRIRVGGESFAAQVRIVSAGSAAQLCAEVSELSRKKYGWGDGVVVEVTAVGK